MLAYDPSSLRKLLESARPDVELGGVLKSPPPWTDIFPYEELVPILTWLEFTRSLSTPAVSTVNVSAAGNLNAVSVSPVWIILSAIEKSPVAPDAFDAVPVTSPIASPSRLPMNRVAVTKPVTLMPPVPVINLPLRSKFPPSCGVVSSTTFLRNVLANLPSAIDPAS